MFRRFEYDANEKKPYLEMGDAELTVCYSTAYHGFASTGRRDIGMGSDHGRHVPPRTPLPFQPSKTRLLTRMAMSRADSMALSALPSPSSEIWLSDTSPKNRCVHIKSWIARYEVGEARLDAATSFIKQAVSLDQREVLIEVTWQVVEQAHRSSPSSWLSSCHQVEQRCPWRATARVVNFVISHATSQSYRNDPRYSDHIQGDTRFCQSTNWRIGWFMLVSRTSFSHWPCWQCPQM